MNQKLSEKLRPPQTADPATDQRRFRSVHVAMVMLVATLLAATSGCKKAPPPAAPPPVVEVMEVTATNAPTSVEFIGQLDSPQNVEVCARVEAFVDKVIFIEGSEVKAGDPLFALD